MKKNRTLIIALLIIAALAIGIGYAALSSTLQINAVIENDPANVHVVFTESTLTAESPTADRVSLIENASEAGSPGTATLAIQAANLKEVGDKVTFNVKIQNQGNLTVVVKELDPTSAFSSEYYSLTVTSWADDLELAPQGTADATIVVEVIKLTDTQQVANFQLEAQATPKNGN